MTLSPPESVLGADHLPALLEAAGVGVWQLALPERRLIWSQQCKALFFFGPQAEPTYEQLLATVHPEDRPYFQARLAQALNPAGDGRYENEYRIQEPGYRGQQRWIRSVGQAVFDEARTAALRLEGVSTDITDTKRQAADLEQHLRTFEFMAEAVPNIVWMARADGATIYLNRRWSDYSGQTLAEAREWGWGPMIHPDDLSTVLTRWNRSMQSGQPFEAEYRLRAQDGTYRWFLGRALPQRDAGGRTEKWFGTATDINALKQIQAVLRQREQEFTTLADSIPQLAWMTDATGFILWYNRRWYEYTGTTLEEMRGWGWSKVHHPDHYARVLERWTAALETGDAWEDTFPLRRHDGEYQLFLSRAYPVRDEQGRIQHWFGTNTNISEPKPAPAAPQTTA